MSGIHETIIRLSRKEIQKAMNQAQRLDRDYLDRQLAQQKEAATRRVNDLSHRLDQQNKRAGQYETRLAGLDKTLQQTRLQHCHEMKQLRQNFQNDVNGLNSRMDHLDDRLDTQRQEFLSRLKTQGDQFQHALDQHGQQLNQISQSINQRIDHQEAIAGQWITALSDELDFIRKHYRHDLFSPGDIKALDADLSMARNDMKQSVPQSALSLSRSAFHKACQLHDKLEYMESVWNILYPVAAEALSNTYLRIVSNKDVQITMDGTSGEAVALDIDYWTWNQRQELEDELKSLKKRLEDAPDTLNIADLEQMIGRAGQASVILDELYQQSLTRMIASVKRNDIQDQIQETLSTLGYEIVEATLKGETGEDFRGGHFMKLKNASGEEIVTAVEPGQDEIEGEQRIRFNFYDKSPNEALRVERIKTIGDALKNEGLEVSPSQCLPEYRNKNAPDDVRDFSRCRQPLTPPRKKIST